MGSAYYFAWTWDGQAIQYLGYHYGESERDSETALLEKNDLYGLTQWVVTLREDGYYEKSWHSRFLMRADATPELNPPPALSHAWVSAGLKNLPMNLPENVKVVLRVWRGFIIRWMNLLMEPWPYPNYYAAHGDPGQSRRRVYLAELADYNFWSKLVTWSPADPYDHTNVGAGPFSSPVELWDWTVQYIGSPPMGHDPVAWEPSEETADTYYDTYEVMIAALGLVGLLIEALVWLIVELCGEPNGADLFGAVDNRTPEELTESFNYAMRIPITMLDAINKALGNTLGEQDPQDRAVWEVLLYDYGA